MSHELGPIAFEKSQPQFLEGYSNPRRSVSPKVAEEIDRQVKEIIDGAHEMALQILRHNQALLEETAQTLLQKVWKVRKKETKFSREPNFTAFHSG